jgi:hypothetical protein
MHIFLPTDSIPLKAITVVFPVLISMKNSVAILFKLYTEYYYIFHLHIWPEGSDHLQIAQYKR